MPSEDDKKGAQAPSGENSPENNTPEGTVPTAPSSSEEFGATSYSPATDDPYAQHPDPYQHENDTSSTVAAEPTTAIAKRGAAPPPPPPPPPPSDGDDDDDEGMLRMSFMEHLEELRTRIIRSLAGIGIAFVLCLFFANELWEIVQKPAAAALTHMGLAPDLAQISPMDAFTTIWVKLPMLASVFLASPWILYQVWAFIAPGLFRKERRWAGPFVICTAGLFILGGLFGYFVAFRYGLEFLLGIGRNIHVKPVVSIVEYFDLFVNVMLGIGLVFEMPVLIFFLTLLRIASPRFLLSHSRYAILGITIIAAIITPTPDVFNLMLFTVPMCLLFFLGCFAGYLLQLHRENQKFPWKPVLIVAAIVLLIAVLIAAGFQYYHFKLVPKWPYLVR